MFQATWIQAAGRARVPFPRARAESSCVSPLKRGQLFLPSGRTAGDLEAAFHQWGGTNVGRPHLRSDGAGAATCTADVWADGTDWIIRRRREWWTMSELGVLDDENCITGLMRNLAKRQAQKPIPGKSGNKRNKKKVKNEKNKII